MAADSTLLNPVSPAERIEVLDVIRGIAVSGILFVNIMAFSGIEFVNPAQLSTLPLHSLDSVTAFLVNLLVHAKFYSLFSLLFGIGFAIFMQRADARGVPAIPLFRRRLIGLLVIGVVHSIMLWFGDILHLYALLGFLLIVFYRTPSRRLLHWGVLFLALPVVLHAFLVVAGPSGAPDGSGGDIPPVIARSIEAFDHGGYPAVVRANTVFAAAGLVLHRFLSMQALRVFGMFLLGLYVVRRGLLDVEAHRGWYRRAALWGLAIGLPASAAAALLPPSLLPQPTWESWGRSFFEAVGALALCTAYATSIALLWRSPGMQRLLRVFAPLGRMALTGYLLQSVIAIAVFYGLGGGLFGDMSLTAAELVAIGVVLVELGIASAWLRRHPQGPLEWLWRRFTYGGSTVDQGRVRSG